MSSAEPYSNLWLCHEPARSCADRDGAMPAKGCRLLQPSLLTTGGVPGVRSLCHPNLFTATEQGGTRNPWPCGGPPVFTENAQRWAVPGRWAAGSQFPSAHWMAVHRCLMPRTTPKPVLCQCPSCNASFSYAYKGFPTFFVNAANNWRVTPALRFKQRVNGHKC